MSLFVDHDFNKSAIFHIVILFHCLVCRPAIVAVLSERDRHHLYLPSGNTPQKSRMARFSSSLLQSYDLYEIRLTLRVIGWRRNISHGVCPCLPQATSFITRGDLEASAFTTSFLDFGVRTILGGQERYIFRKIHF